eukprot:scaffold4845_cov62-Phaeocystis_antarctica.AAC.5
MSNRVRPAAHHDATVHLVPRGLPTNTVVCHKGWTRGLNERRDKAKRGEADPEGVNSGIIAPESTAYTKRMRPSDNPPRGTPESCF